ncbi:S24 family peptidase [Sphingobium lignivorans]|uniref:Phage repressor protein C with HTH and peptisase S24 domain n=1 Tax=Sphingobium lignivorans TaxID=2735886 RepID=A0ABR6NJD2_9SPHN|nr:S24 family peptidase [Sphingobium lignivorans]MBB5987390.1 phage repressor protein C with HTH and peptisase S24 domain [Sphingobium lignivorans]
MDGLEQDRQLVRALAEFAGLTPAALARAAGVAVTTINRPYNGTATTRLSQPTLEKLRARFPTYPGWTEQEASVAVPKVAGTYRPAEDGRPELVEVAEIDLRFGLGGAFMDEHPEIQVRSFSRAWLRQITTSPPDQLCWAKGRGNSMEPTISDGDIILIDRTEQRVDYGDLYWAIAFGQVGMIKRLRPMPDGSVKILSDNPSVPPDVAVDDELHVFGRVVAIVKKV